MPGKDRSRVAASKILLGARVTGIGQLGRAPLNTARVTKKDFVVFLHTKYDPFVLKVMDSLSPAAAIAADLRALIGQLRRRLQEQSQLGDLTPAQSAVLLRLWREGPATVTAMARAEGVRPQSMGATVSALEAAGLVRGAPDPTDGRQTILSMTEGCAQRIRLGQAAKQDFLAGLIATRFTAAELPELGRAVRLLARLADAAQPSQDTRD